MNATKLAIPFVFACAAFGQAQAVDYDGSDTLITVTNYLIDNYPCGDIDYLGNGSSAGETAMCDGNQVTAPMSRALRQSKVCAGGSCAASAPNPMNREIGWDGLAVARHRPDTDQCNDLGGAQWDTTLRTIYGGVDGSGSFAACDDPARHQLLNNYDEVFNRAGLGCGTESCTELRHAYRRGERSGTTGVFKSLVGVDNFCNVEDPASEDHLLNDNQDNDPVRRCCATNDAERYCPGNPDYDPYVMPDGSTCARTLGVVLPIDMPESDNDAFFAGAVNNGACATGRFGWALPFTGRTTCPTGGPRTGGLCRYPLDANNEFGCNANRNNRPAGVPFSWDARTYNETPRYADGRVVYNPLTDRAEFWRLSLGCEFSSSTDEIGCLVAANECSIGWAGREMLAVNPDAEAVEIGGTSPVVDADILSGAYPLARKLYFNTLDGFNVPAADAEEVALEACYADPVRVAEAMAFAGYIPLDDTQPLPEVNACP